MSTAFDEEYLTVAEAAILFKVSQSTVWRWINQREIPAYRVGQRRVRLKRGELAQLVSPAREGQEKGERMGQKERLLLGPLSSQEQKRMLAAIAEARRAQAEMLKARSGRPFPSSAEIIDELREQRTRERS